MHVLWHLPLLRLHLQILITSPLQTMWRLRPLPRSTDSLVYCNLLSALAVDLPLRPGRRIKRRGVGTRCPLQLRQRASGCWLHAALPELLLWQWKSRRWSTLPGVPLFELLSYLWSVFNDLLLGRHSVGMCNESVSVLHLQYACRVG